MGVSKKPSGTTANRVLAILSSLFKYAIELDLIESNPCAGVRNLPENKSRDRFLHPDEYKRFVNVLKNGLDKPAYQLIFLLIALGVRKGELMNLRWSEVNLSDEGATIHLLDPKNGESRYVAVNSVALELLKKMHRQRKKSCPWVFPSKKSKSGHLVDIRRPFKQICSEAGIENFRPHDARRTVASTLLNSGVDVMVIKELLAVRRT